MPRRILRLPASWISDSTCFATRSCGLRASHALASTPMGKTPTCTLRRPTAPAEVAWVRPSTLAAEMEVVGEGPRVEADQVGAEQAFQSSRRSRQDAEHLRAPGMGCAGRSRCAPWAPAP